ncbi:MAG: RloB family protein [Eubacteriales bacterium]|nr:RloB family protein [Eubacteriales bacterium]
MPFITSRVPFSIQNPYRTVRPKTSKIIFLSLEGSVTEEEYFERISDIFSEIRSKIQFISVAEDAVHTAPRCRTSEQAKLLSKVRPKQLVERIDRFKQEKDDIYQFTQYPEDEFWIVTDVDKNWSDEIISPSDGRTYLDEWNNAISVCRSKNYGYAVSNPFFEIWLLLHHDVANDVDKSFAVTNEHEYEKTDHFRNRLKNLGVALEDKKHINFSDYNAENVRTAIARAEELHLDKSDSCPRYFATTVYLLLNKMMEMLSENNNSAGQ